MGNLCMKKYLPYFMPWINYNKKRFLMLFFDSEADYQIQILFLILFLKNTIGLFTGIIKFQILNANNQ